MAVAHEGCALRPETNENSATKARRHKGILFFLTWCPGVLLAIFIGVPHDASLTQRQ